MNKIKIELGGKERELRFGLKVIGDCIKHQGNDPGAFLGSLASNPFESIPVMIYYGMKWAEEREGNIPKFTLADVYDWVEAEGIESEKVDNVSRAFVRSLYDNVPAIKQMVDEQPEEVKKNLIGITM